ncbi:hypothetical protein HY251_19840 [bacterium]|nr:hypothetical protein [bacterium]
MLVGRGSITIRTYRVSGKHATPQNATIADKLSAFRFTGLGDKDEGAATGWIAPDHLFDGEFEPAKIFRGPFACFALRIDTRKVPAPLLAAHVALEEKAWREKNGEDARSAEGGTSGESRIPPAKRREIKREVKEKLLAELPPVQRAYGVFWHVREKKLFFQSTSKGTNEELKELFARTFDLTLEARLPSAIADDTTEGEGRNARLSLLRDAVPLSLSAKANGSKKRPAPSPVNTATE